MDICMYTVPGDAYLEGKNEGDGTSFSIFIVIVQNRDKAVISLRLD